MSVEEQKDKRVHIQFSFMTYKTVDRGRDEQLYDMLTDSRIYLERKNKDYVL